MITIEIWSDIACPFCYIGKSHFEKAVERSGLKYQIKWEWRSYQLDPEAPKNDERTIYKILADKYQQTEEKARSMTMNVISMAHKTGLEFNMDILKPANTFDAHRLIHFAKENGKQNEMKERLFKAYFTEGQNVSDSATLIQLADEVGLDKGEAFLILDEGKYADEVRKDMETAQALGIQGVPFFLINKKYGVSGAQPISSFMDVFEQILEKERTAVK